MSVKARIAVNQTLLWTTQKMKKDAVPCGGGGSQVKRAVVHWQSWGVVLSPPLEGRAGCLGGAYGTGAGLFGTTALLLSTTAFGTAVCRMALCWQGVNCKALTRSVSLDRALWPPPLGGIVASGGGLEQVLQQYSFVSCRRRPAHRPVKYKIQKLFCQFWSWVGKSLCCSKALLDLFDVALKRNAHQKYQSVCLPGSLCYGGKS